MARSLETLFERYRRRGDVAALGAVFDRTAPELFRIAVHLTRDPSVAEDVLQETFLAAIEQRERFDASRRLLPWLTGILANHARRAGRAKGRSPDPARLAVGDAHHDGAPAGEITGEVARAIERLDKPYREVVLLHLRHGLAPADIALVTDRAPGTVRAQLHRGLEKLRDRLPGGVLAAFVPAVPAMQGLDAIRASVVTKAGTAVSTAAATTTTTLVLGGLVVSKTWMTVVTVAALLALGLGGVWFANPAWSPFEMSDGGAQTSTLRADSEAADGGPSLASQADAARPTEAGEAVTETPSRPTWQLVGVVRDVRTVDVVPGATLDIELVRGTQRQRLPTVMSDAEGAYAVSLADLAAGSPLLRGATRVILTATAPGFIGGKEALDALPRDTREPVRLDVDMLPGVRIVGRVVDAAGRPVAGARVGRAGTDRNRVPSYEVKTDAEGYYRTGVEAGATFVLVVMDDRGTAISKPVTLEKTDPITMPDLVVREVAWLEGVVVRSDGSPVAGVRVEGSHPEGEIDPHELPYSLVHHRTATRTGADGRFRLPTHREGPITVSLDGVVGSAAKHVYAHAVEPGTRDIRLIADVQRVDVRVVDDAGAALPGMPVVWVGCSPTTRVWFERFEQGTIARGVLYLHADIHAKAPADADGRAGIWVPAGSSLLATARIDQGVPGEAIVYASTQAARSDLVVPSPAPVRARLAPRLRLPDGTLWKDLEVVLQTNRGSPVRIAWTDASGEAVDLPPGTWRVGLAPPASKLDLRRRFPRTTGEVTLTPGKTTSLVLDATEAGRLQLHLQSDAKALSRSARIRLERVIDGGRVYQSYGFWRTPRGRSMRTSEGLPTGVVLQATETFLPDAYVLTAILSGGRRLERSIHIRPGETTRVDLDLR